MALQPPTPVPVTRRQFLRDGGRLAAMTGLGAFLGVAASRTGTGPSYVWQIDPAKCVYCGNCATACVLKPSAVKCVQSYEICGYCDLCTGFLRTDAPELGTAAEDQLCPFAAIKRTFIEDPYFEYEIDESACVGCARCVQGCSAYGNGSMFLQIRHDRCVNCNQCSIAAACPAMAIKRVSSDHPYLLKNQNPKSGDKNS